MLSRCIALNQVSSEKCHKKRIPEWWHKRIDLSESCDRRKASIADLSSPLLHSSHSGLEQQSTATYNGVNKSESQEVNKRMEKVIDEQGKVNR